ncbi:MAG: chemotaxis protein CheX [Lachnospiraceae bacterium]|nr:chemotaxis protein CheX [Lachnospiraceae bacterium]MBO7633909.1 chemotaxis protein CheX [Lachnospiraceae bacterium]MBP5653496.1 chemotaxis protein CheX [Lachnospiraceae bacterium]
MATINVNYINPLLKASVSVIEQACGLNVAIGKPALKDAQFTSDELLILMGITGEMKGQAILDFPMPAALQIASKMCMMEVTELSDLAQSAICELCNMIMGNTATLFYQSGTQIDITPPTICKGNVSFGNNYAANICIPFNYEDKYFFAINIAIKED